MVSAARVIKNSLSVNNSVIDSCVLDIDETGTTVLKSCCILERVIQTVVLYAVKDVLSMTRVVYTVNGEH